MTDHGRLLVDEPVADLDAWLAGDGGLGYAHALDMEPDDVVDAIEAAALRGRGGAGFPTATKWRSTTAAAREAGGVPTLVCNAAEGEPGTFKDRTLMEHNPYAVLEGMLVAMHATGAVDAFVGVKEKFTVAVERLVTARDEMVAAGWQGAAGIRIVPGPDDYLFGEETAMLEVVEGRAPMPRLLPPYQQGLFGTTVEPHPTVVNNVETYAHATSILANGVDWFREVGTDSSPGTMVFTVTGDVTAPGVYELPLGTPLRTLVVDIAGADPDDLLAIFSGTSNTVVRPDQLDTPMDFDTMAEVGTGMGSGGFVVYDRTRCIVQVLATLARFLGLESCGQCNACKLGTTTVAELLARIDAGEGDSDDLDAIVARVPTMTDQARCYLPTGAQLTVGSVLESYWEDVVAHLGRACPSARPVPTPLVESIDADTGEVRWHPTYDREGGAGTRFG